MRRFALPLVFVAWLGAAQWRVMERLLFSDEASVAFVVESVRGVLAGTPVSKSWQHRFLGPLATVAFGGADVASLKRFTALAIVAANLLLFALLARRGVTVVRALLAVAIFGFAHFVLAYKLEYPWDGVDRLLFISFGAWAARGERRLLPLVPLFLVGALNHETILYVSLWLLLSSRRTERVAGAASAVAVGLVVAALRVVFYRGRPTLPGQVFEVPTPLLENHVHIAHNLRMLVVDNWGAGRGVVSVGFLAAAAALVAVLLRARGDGVRDVRQAAAWALSVLATIVAFGYVNETRHYLLLAAFAVPFAVLTRAAPSDAA